ncbi:hypothetical protein CLF_107438, partial [Clonorchis sinensis]
MQLKCLVFSFHIQLGRAIKAFYLPSSRLTLSTSNPTNTSRQDRLVPLLQKNYQWIPFMCALSSLILVVGRTTLTVGNIDGNWTGCQLTTTKLFAYLRLRNSHQETTRGNLELTILWSPQVNLHSIRVPRKPEQDVQLSILGIPKHDTCLERCWWTADPNDWGHYRWRMEQVKVIEGQSQTVDGLDQRFLCLHRPQTLQTTGPLVSRMWSPSIGTGRPSSSEPVHVLENEAEIPQCLTLLYRVFPGSAGVPISSTSPTPQLSILRRQRGLATFVVDYWDNVVFILARTMKMDSSFPDVPVVHRPLDCNFTDSFCRWSNDQNNWPINWELRPVDWKISIGNELCLKVPSIPQKADLSARLFGPLLSASDNTRCLRLAYVIHPHPSFSSGLDRAGPKLALMRRQMGWGLPVEDISGDLSALLHCNFESSEWKFCHWTTDPRDTGVLWSILDVNNNGAACLSPAPFPRLRFGSQPSGSLALTGRLWSQTIFANFPASPEMLSGHGIGAPQCIQLSYYLQAAKDTPIMIDKSGTGLSEMRLSLLKHSTGPVNCTFENGKFCGWKDDPRDVIASWQVVRLPDPPGFAACLQATGVWDSSATDAVQAEGSARLWSGHISPKSGSLIQCLTLRYRFFSSNPIIRLALMRHSAGHQPLLDCNFTSSTCNWANDHNNWPVNWRVVNKSVCLELKSNSEVDSTQAVYGEATSRRQRIRPSQSKDPLNCTYEDGDFCGWNDDPRDVLAWWEVIAIPDRFTNAVCLLASTELGDASQSRLIVISNGSARLWSGQVRVNQNGVNTVQCLRFSYQTTPFITNRTRLSTAPTHEQTNSPADCSFDRGHMCGWMPDPRDGGAQWTVSSVTHSEEHRNQALCLASTPAPYALNFVDEGMNRDPTATLSARLWSRKFYQLQKNFRCLSFVFYITHCAELDRITKASSCPHLSVLRHSSGACVHQADQNLELGVVMQSSKCRNELLWTAVPEHRTTSLDSWKLAYIPVVRVTETSADAGAFKLILEGTIPAGYPDARICVDNITSYTEPCSALQKTAAVVSSHWSWAQYFGITFITALILGLTIPILFLVILIWACRRRHHNMNSPYTDNKLFSTNLWYYIGGKEINDDPTGFRGASSLIRSNKHCHPSSGAGTLRNNTQVVPDVMDLPDVVIPGGRVVSFNYSGNTLGPGGTLRHMSQTSSQLMQPTNCFNTGLTMGTVSSQSSGTPATTVGRSGQDGVLQPDPNFNFQQQQQQNQQQHNGLLGGVSKARIFYLIDESSVWIHLPSFHSSFSVIVTAKLVIFPYNTGCFRTSWPLMKQGVLLNSVNLIRYFYFRTYGR